MTERKIRKTVTGNPAVDGAGVRLTRVLGHDTVYDFDPFLMLDSFDSSDPRDYIAGFPLHPHRGIETVTYLIKGKMHHKDSLGNKGVIGSGQSQWMTAGSGILHEEMPQPAERLLGLQLWINLPKKDKMTHPKYFDITESMMGIKILDNATVRVISGEFMGEKGVKTHHIVTEYYDVSLDSGSISIDTDPENTVFIFPILGDAEIHGRALPEKTAALFGEGDTVTVAATNGSCRFMLLSARPLNEEISWGGPIVMNTREELQQAFAELKTGDFLKHRN